MRGRSLLACIFKAGASAVMVKALTLGHVGTPHCPCNGDVARHHTAWCGVDVLCSCHASSLHDALLFSFSVGTFQNCVEAGSGFSISNCFDTANGLVWVKHVAPVWNLYWFYFNLVKNNCSSN